jgi:hypothetical protein
LLNNLWVIERGVALPKAALVPSGTAGPAEPAGAENLHFTLNGEMRKAPGAASGWRPYGLGRHGPGELRSTAVAPQTSLGQSSIAPLDRLTSTREKKRETE